MIPEKIDAGRNRFYVATIIRRGSGLCSNVSGSIRFSANSIFPKTLQNSKLNRKPFGRKPVSFEIAVRTPMADRYFMRMIQDLRQREEIMLFDNILIVNEVEALEVTDFLAAEYRRESTLHPPDLPEFNRNAACWAAKTCYKTAQLVLYRENPPEEFTQLLPDFDNVVDASALISADLCLRFLPSMIRQLQFLDGHDTLIPHLEGFLKRFHYSGIAYPLNTAELDFSVIKENAFMKNLYCARIVDNRKLQLAKVSPFRETIAAWMGIHGKILWKEFNLDQ